MHAHISIYVHRALLHQLRMKCMIKKYRASDFSTYRTGSKGLCGELSPQLQSGSTAIEFQLLQQARVLSWAGHDGHVAMVLGR